MVWQILIDDPVRVKPIKTRLEQENSFIKPIGNTVIDDVNYKIIKTNIADLEFLRQIIPSETKFEEYDIVTEQINQFDLNSIVKQKLIAMGKSNEVIMELLEHLPMKYSIYPPLILLNNSSQRTFTHDCFKENLDMDEMESIYSSILDKFKINIIAMNKPIEENDLMRQPHNLQILYPIQKDNLDIDTIWCEVKQNSIWQIWNPMYTMFSRGNIKEKKRILDTFIEVEGNDVIDLYCGIGYFTFCYLKLQCRHLFGFELNQWSVEGLHKGLIANKNFNNLSGVHIYNENNENSISRIRDFIMNENDSKKLRIRHINLGLLPSSKQGYPIALEILDRFNDWQLIPKSTLHIHENVHIRDIDSGKFVEGLLGELERIHREKSGKVGRATPSSDKIAPSAVGPQGNFPNGTGPHGLCQFTVDHVEKIKTFAPDVWHVCADVSVAMSRDLVDRHTSTSNIHTTQVTSLRQQHPLPFLNLSETPARKQKTRLFEKVKTEK